MRIFLLFIVSLFLSALSFGQINSLGIPFNKNYLSEEYDASEQNWSAVQDLRGVMYFGNNDDGVLEFDGINWRRIRIPNQAIVRSLSVSTKGTVFVGAVGEIGYLAPDKTGNMVYNTLIDQLDSTQTHFGNVWKTYSIGEKTYFCTQDNIFIYNNITFEKCITFNYKYCFMSFFADDKIYIGNYLEGLTYLQEDTLAIVKGGDFFIKKNIMTILPFSTDELLIGTVSNGVFSYNLKTGEVTDTIVSDKVNNFLKENSLYNALVLDDGSIAFASLFNGTIIVNREGNIVNHYRKSNGMQDETVTYLYQNVIDEQPQPLWMTLNSGIHKTQINSPIKYLSESDGLKGAVNAITRFNGVLYVATSSGVFYLIFNEEGFPEFRQVEEITKSCWNLLTFKPFDKEESVLLAGTSEGLFEIKKDQNAVSLEPNISFDREIPAGFQYYDIYMLSQSNFNPNIIYLGAYEFAILEYTGKGQWREKLNLNKTIVKDEVRSIQDDGHGYVWLSTSFNGIIRYKDQDGTPEINYYETSHGLPTLNTNFVEYFDNLYFLTTDGLYNFDYDNERFVVCSDFGKRFESGFSVFRMVKENSNKYWFSLNIENPLEKWIESVQLSESGPVYDTISLGILPNLSIDAIYNDKNGYIWFGNSKGIYSYKSDYKKDYKQKYYCLVREVFLAGEDSVLFKGSNYLINPDGSLITSFEQPEDLKPKLSFSTNNLTFRFAAPFFENEEAIEYSYILLGYDNNWSKFGSEHYKDFTNLDEGDYTFMVKARNIYGIESEVGKYEFTILPPWYRTIWAYIGYVIFSIILIIVIVKLYTRRLEREKIRLEGIVKERTAEVVRQKEDIEKKNSILEVQKEEIERKNLALEQQKEEITHQRDHIQEINQELTDSIQYAKRIQKAILPNEDFARKILPDHFILFKPKDIVSGDFYWAGMIKNWVLVSAADCTGHGVPGAFMSMLGVAFLNEVVKDKDVVNAGMVLDSLRGHIIKSLQQTGKEGEQKDGMDMSICAINIIDNFMYWAGANNPLYFIREKKTENDTLSVMIGDEETFIEPNMSSDTHHLFELKPDKMPIAIYIKMDDFTNCKVDLQDGDSFFLFTDGFADQFGGEKGKKFKYKPFKQLILDNQHKPMAEQQILLDEAIEAWKAFEDPVTGNDSFEQVDDICVVGIKWKM